jgi:hypothetical protein
VRYLILVLLAVVGLACSEEGPVGFGRFVWPPTATVEGRVVSQSGAGIGNATITVTALRPQPILSVGIPTVSDVDGHFKLSVQIIGDVVVPSLDTASVQFATQRSGASPATQIDTVLLRFGPTSLDVPSPVVNRLDVRWRGQ